MAEMADAKKQIFAQESRIKALEDRVARLEGGSTSVSGEENAKDNDDCAE